MKYTPEQKKAYFQGLRKQWKHAKETADIDKIKAIIENHGWNISALNYAIIASQMKAQEFNGIPYLDAKTYKGWIENGYKVRTGEHSTLSGITWITVNKKHTDDDPINEDNTYLLPKEYHLFHRSQVDPIK